MIEVKDLVKKYDGHLAVDHLSFNVEKGQVLGFLGPNGAGKSTTMNIITGYISATEGTVVIDGYDILEEPEKAKSCIGYLPEIPPLYPDMTVREYLKFAAEIKKVSRNMQSKMIQDIMEQTKIADVSERLIKHLSKGYKQRVGLAEALIGDPEVLILDEPTVGLDPMQITEIRDLMKELSKNHTVILSSHILSEVSAVCDKVLIINKGKMVVIDTPDMLSKRMSSSNTVHLLVKGEEEKVTQIIAGFAEIESMELKSSEEEGCVDVSVVSSGEQDIREQLFYAMADAKCPILSMETTKMSLEDIFIELTKEDQVDESDL